MTTRSRVSSGSDDAPVAVTRYGDDLYGWVEQQVALLRAGRFTEIDAGNIAEELSDVGGEQYDKLESALRVLMLHLLKWDHQPSHRSRSWVVSIREQRRRMERVLRKNPSLKPRIPEAMVEAYEDARDDAIRETELGAAVFPPECPYDWIAMTARVVEWNDLRSPQAGEG